MVVIGKQVYTDVNGTVGELRHGIASWDDGDRSQFSVKWAYRDGSGRISRGSPEISIDVLVQLFCFAYRNGLLNEEHLELFKKVQQYFVYTNWQATKEVTATIHRSFCSFCNEGHGVHGIPINGILDTDNGEWSLALDSKREANIYAFDNASKYAQDRGIKVKECGYCCGI